MQHTYRPTFLATCRGRDKCQGAGAFLSFAEHVVRLRLGKLESRLSSFGKFAQVGTISRTCPSPWRGNWGEINLCLMDAWILGKES